MGMNMHTVLLYACAAAVLVSGVRVLAASAVPAGGAQTPPPAAFLAAWRGPVPRAAAALVGVMVAAGVAQIAAPGMIDALERQPGGEWWRAVTALFVQSSGWFQLLFNLAALVVVAPIAERRFGPWRALLLFLVSGVAAQAVSMAGWSERGGGDSVAICGLVGALAVRYAVRRDGDTGLRAAALVVPAAGVVLCLLANNHGVGLLAGAALALVV
jgi:rhomboid protease GluP